ncbi:hypothetical protein J6590_064731 [Homalodisca vitripennis]|nr:hypothetical protein J6590_064731 [Homalodisca vitripennis]
MVLQKQAEAAAVDSNTLAYNKVHLQDRGKDLFVLESLGPLPPYPIVVNSRLPGELKNKLSTALLKLTDTRLWGERISKFGITGFKKNNIDEYEQDHMKPGDASMSMVDRAGAVTGKVKVSDYLVLVGGTNCVTEENVGRLGPTRT